MPAHAVAECAGSLLEGGPATPGGLLVLASMPFAGALGDITAALCGLVGAHSAVAVASEFVLAGGRMNHGSPALAVMYLPAREGDLSRLDAREELHGVPGHLGVVLRDPHRPPTGPVASPSMPDGPTVLAADLLGARLAGGNRLVRAGAGRPEEYDDGAVALRLEASSCAVEEVEGFEAFGDPIQVDATDGYSVVALGGLPAAEAFEASAARAADALDSAKELGLRRVAGASSGADPWSTNPTVFVRRGPRGLVCSAELSPGDVVEPVFRSEASIAAALAGTLSPDAGMALSLLDARTPAASQVTGRSRLGGDRLAVAISEAAGGEHLGLVAGAVHRGRPAGAPWPAVTVVRVPRT